MLERLQKIIASRGYCSRRKAEELIVQGKVKVNGQIITELGSKFEENVKIEILGLENNNSKDLVTFIFNKPLGVISSVKDDRGRKVVTDFFKNEPYRLYPVGRLDYNTSGLLLMTNDGELSNLVTHPSTQIEKTYFVVIEGRIKDEEIKALEKGVLLEDGMTAPSKIKIFYQDNEITKLFITIHEGKNREVRRMFEHFSYHVKSLNREALEFLNIEDLKRGEYRKLSSLEIEKLKSICKTRKVKNVIPDYKKL